jgi:hypothetical protein
LLGPSGAGAVSGAPHLVAAAFLLTWLQAGVNKIQIFEQTIITKNIIKIFTDLSHPVATRMS